MTDMQEAILQFEKLQEKRKEMMKTALTTAELIEPVPRSIMLATLTNNLPPGASLSDVMLQQKIAKNNRMPKKSTSQFKAATDKFTGAKTEAMSYERQLETLIDIVGMAPTDLQVAAYIERLGLSPLLEQVALVESIEKTVDNAIYRHFKLTAKLKREVHLTKDDVERIRSRAEKTVYHF
ncbi:PilN domain-containing protein [Planctomycetota bacterium]